ncbi:hypothetical protein HOP51_20655 [Halomonas sp. MCCC 1A11036]|uniref:Uncharacterized protein n=1 Tax=Billgrantia zhangzhouensis TaxID=2733481 RepID=A0ABS9AL65_9GAMM|nr:hypothetical protein [Halomonas zhangzhouensis]MCE8022500.1 hypothetical protein [Halomonas zhangzhouensis]
MSNYKGMGMLMAALSLGLATTAFGQDAFPEPSTSAQPGSIAEEAQIGTIEAREDDLGVARDDSEQDMHGTGADDEAVSGSAATSGQERDEGSPYADLEPDDPGLDEPRQPIRPGQMEQERERVE